MSDAKKLVIVGGGTAGWLTALGCQKRYPDYNITVIASEEIGILGAGEGTVPHFIGFLKFLDISPKELFINCKATLKLGIDFINWHGNEESFWHGFDSGKKNASLDYKSFTIDEYAVLAKNPDLFDECTLHKHLSKNKKAPFVLESSGLEPAGFYALHFDAVLLAEFLKKKALSRGVHYKNDEVVDVKVQKQNVKQLSLNSGETVIPDFVFDCSGLRRLILGNKLKAKWLSYQDTLHVNRALPFFIPHDNDIEPCTSAIAMDYGWVWKIPVQDRYGCGYVFDDTEISVAQAKQEIEKRFGIKLDSEKTFEFSAGAYQTPYIGNCLGLGLAHSFLEPMEATSIWCTCFMLQCFFEYDGLHNQSRYFYKQYNEKILNITNEFKNFIALHYKTGREDTSFWKKYQKSSVENDYAEVFEYDFGYPVDFKAFSTWSWFLFLNKTKTLSYSNAVKNQVLNIEFGRNEIKNKTTRIKSIVETCVTHKQFIDYAKVANG